MKLTLPHLQLSPFKPRIQFPHCIQCHEDLYRADRIQHVRIVTRSGTETTVVVEAREDKGNDIRAIEGGGCAEKVRGG